MAIATPQTEVGTTLPPISMKMTLQKQIDRDPLEVPGRKGLHSSYEAAIREGLSAPAVSAAMITATISRMMTVFFAEGWVKGGKISVKFAKPIPPDDFLTAKGVVTGKVEEEAGVRLICDVWVENQHRDKVIVGTASGLVV